jgi:hypothetical protein
VQVVDFEEGLDEAIVPFDGGVVPKAVDCPTDGGACTDPTVPSATANISTWASLDRCGAFETDPLNPICRMYGGCAAPVEMCVSPSSVHCGSYASVHIVDTAWAAFRRAAVP